jgi:hypothetical protein
MPERPECRSADEIVVFLTLGLMLRVLGGVVEDRWVVWKMT